MNRTLVKKSFLKLAAWSGVVLLCAVVALAQDAAAGQTQGQRTDGQIEMDVVHALDGSAALKNDLITAATIQSEVTLSGTVSSDSSKQLAESLVAHVDGVTKVHNNLKIGNPGAEAQNPEPAPESSATANADPSQAQQGMANLPASGPAPDASATQSQPVPDQSQASPDQSQAAAQPYPTVPPQSQQPYPQRPQYAPYPPPPPGYAPYPPQYAYQQYPAAPPAPAYAQARGPVTISQGTLLQLRTSEAVESKHATQDQPVQFTVLQDVVVGNVLAIPRGATVHGVVTESKNAGSGKLAGSSELALTLTSLDLGGRNYPLDSDEFRVKGPNKAGQTVGSAVTGGIIGTIIGCAAGRGAGCAIGAGAGVAAGTAAGAAAPGPRAWIPAEALVSFHLTAPLTVEPVSLQEASRLAQGLYPGGPALYRRGPYGYGPGYYAYPAPYYRPYYVVGGAYYWR
jgi:hypothetical protein